MKKKEGCQMATTKKKNALTHEQNARYRELMWIAQFGDFMSNFEFEELGKLLKLKNYK
jgi:hypothetical protein